MEFSKIQVLIYHQDFCLLSLEHVCAIFSSLQINMNFTCRIFPLSCFCEKKEKRKKKNILAQFFPLSPAIRTKHVLCKDEGMAGKRICKQETYEIYLEQRHNISRWG